MNKKTWGIETYLLLLLAVRGRLGQRHLHGVGRAGQDVAVELLHGAHGVVALLEVDEGVVLDLLDALDRPVRLERLLELLFGHVLRQIAHVQHLDLHTPNQSGSSSFFFCILARCDFRDIEFTN